MPHKQPHSDRGTRFPALITGLAVSQIVGTLFVRHSNLAVLGRHQALSAAGWFAIPAGPAVETLKTLAAAFWGGLFYTLSIGSVLTLATWAVLRLGNYLFPGNRRGLLIPIVGWAVLLWHLNRNGTTLFPALFVLCVPLATAITSRTTWSSAPDRERSWLWCLPVLVLIGLTGLWSTQLNKGLFITIRDHVLLSNPLGRTVNNFYYRYTLYAAEPFKSFDQKSIRTCYLEAFTPSPMARRLTERLARHDVLAIADNTVADLIIRQTKDGIALVSPRGRSMTVTPDAFFGNPAQWLKAFSKMEDRYAAFRQLTFAGVLIGFPVLLYVVVYGVLRLLAGMLFTSRRATWITSGACLVLGVLLFVPMLAGRAAVIPPEEMGTALASDDWTRRVTALRHIAEHAMEIAHFPDYRNLLQSPLVVERYWLARALAYSRTPETYQDLLKLMNDVHPNVVCQAYFALGQRGDRAAVEPIKNKMAQSDHWYTQWYGYNAIRKLGWYQTTSK